MSLSKEAIKEFQEIYKKEYGTEIPYEEAAESGRNLVGLFKVLYDCWKEDKIREKKIEEFPKGFCLDGVGYTCSICGNSTQAGGNWYDKFGIKCTTCQGAVNRKEIPPSFAKNKDSWYSKYDLESRFNLTSPILRNWIKKGIIKARTVTRDGQRTHVQLFLIKDNKDTLPPKKLTESRMVKETKGGKDWYHSEPWYRFVDPHEHLKGYKIMDYLKFVKEESNEVKK